MNDPDKRRYIKLLEDLGDLKTNYGDYMITEPIDCNEELKRVSGADYELCTALLTMLLREDHFSNGSFDRRFADGQVLPVLVRMIQKYGDVVLGEIEERNAQLQGK